MKHKSTADATLKLVENLYQSLNSKIIPINIFVDFSKAFDTLNHSILIQKLFTYGIRGQALNLITNYFINRKQYVSFNNVCSTLRDITIGIPQGSVLGPLLFIIYVNDLLNMSNQYLSILFADDTVLSFKGKDMLHLVNICNYELEKFKTWTIANRLTVNKSKTVYNVVSNIDLDLNNVHIYFDLELLNHAPTVRYLGVFLDESLKFKDHIEYVVGKISKAVGILYKLKSSLPNFALKALYYSLVHPYMNYCNLIWGGTFPTHLYPLIILQKRIMRIIFNRPYLEHTKPLFLEARILQIGDLYKYNLSKFMYLNQDNPIYQNRNVYISRQSNLLVPQFQRLSTTQHSINFQGPHLWNQIPDPVKNSDTLAAFMIQSKNHLLNGYLN